MLCGGECWKLCCKKGVIQRLQKNFSSSAFLPTKKVNENVRNLVKLPKVVNKTFSLRFPCFTSSFNYL